MSNSGIPTTKTPYAGNDHGYEVPAKYEMMSQRKYNIALGTAILALILAVLLAWFGLSSGKTQLTQPKTEVNSSAVPAS